MRRISWLALLAVVGFFLMAAPAAGADPVTLKFGTFVPPQAFDVVKVWNPLFQRIMKDSGGTVKIDTYAGSTLGRNPTQYPKLILDRVMDIGFSVNTYQPGRFPDDEIINIPFTTRGSMEATVAFNRMIAKGVVRGYDNFIPLGVLCLYQYSIHTTFPVKTPEDMKGVKIQVSGKLMQTFTEAYGAVPVGIGVTKLAETINRGVVKGTIMEWNALKQWRILEVVPYHCMVPYGAIAISLLMNKDAFNELPPQAKAAFEKNIGEPFAKTWSELYSARVMAIEEEVRNDPKHHIYTPTPSEMEQWKAAIWPAVEKWKEENPKGKMLYDTYLSELEKFRKE